MNYTCPVCGYAEMSDPPMDYNICPCCGTEFDLDDAEKSHSELRDEWLRRGGIWFSEQKLQPGLWNPFVQLTSAGLDYDRRYEPDWVTNHIESRYVAA